jgi:hypothetical protein
MPNVVKALIFCVSALILEGLICFLLLPAMFELSSGQTVVLGLVCMIFAAVYTFVMVLVSVYGMTVKSIWCLLLDITWSLPNTMVGLLWLAYCLIRAPFQTPAGRWETPNEETQRRGVMHVSGVALGTADASTLGNVIGGDWMIHETVHVQQARILGILYWPTYLLSFTFAFIVRLAAIPVWKLAGRFQSGDGSMEKLHDHAYRRTVMEDWAYQATPNNASAIHWDRWVLWLLIGLVCAALVAIAVAPIPFLGAFPRLIGLGAIPWWLGLIGLLVYAIIRSFFRGSEERAPLTAAIPASDGAWA